MLEDDITASARKLKSDILKCDMLLIGIGGEWNRSPDPAFDADSLDRAYNKLADIIKNVNYFVVTSCEDGLIYRSNIDKERLTAPLYDGDNGETQWNRYNSWLQSTLNRNLVILELGEGFASPDFMRWPFEKITFINNKAKFYRVNLKFPNIPENISDKSTAIRYNSVEFVNIYD